MSLIVGVLIIIAIIPLRKINNRTLIWIVSIITWGFSILVLISWAGLYVERLSFQKTPSIPDFDIISVIAGYKVVDPEERESIQETRDRALDYWLTLKNTSEYRGSWWRFTYMYSDEGSEREAKADRAIADAMLQAGRELEIYEIEAISDAFVNPHLESLIEFLLHLPLFLAAVLYTREIRRFSKSLNQDNMARSNTEISS